MIRFVKCTDGKERQIFPAKIKHKDLIRYHTVRFNSATAIVNIIALNNEKIPGAENDSSGEPPFDDAPYNSMMEIIRLAFGEKYSVEEIEQFLDVEMIDEILEVFYGMSSLKKKAAGRTEPIGMNSSRQS